MANNLITESDLVAQGVSIAEQYRLRYEGKLPTQILNGTYVYPEYVAGKLAGGGSGKKTPPARPSDDDETTELAAGQFEAAVSAMTARGVPRRRAISAVAIRRPELHRAYVAHTGGLKSSNSRFNQQDLASLKTAYATAIAQEQSRGHRRSSAIIIANRKHPGLYQALSGLLK